MSTTGSGFDGVRCDVCGERFDPALVVDFQGRTMCGGCKSRTVARLEFGQDATDLTGERKLPPWECRGELGLVKAFLHTTRDVMLTPAEFFRSMDRSRTDYQCLGFIAIVTTLTVLASWLFQTAMGSMFAAAGSQDASQFAGMAAVQGAVGIVMVIVAPLAAVVHAFVAGGVYHLMLLMLKKADAPYHQTMRGYCYAQAPAIIGVVPMIGGSVGGIWALVATIFMVMGIHRTSGGTASLAVLLPVLLCCGGAAVLGFGMVAAIMAGAQ